MAYQKFSEQPAALEINPLDVVVGLKDGRNVIIPIGIFSEFVMGNNLAQAENDVFASKAYVVDDFLVFRGVLYQVTQPIAQGDQLIIDGNIVHATLADAMAAHEEDKDNPHDVTAAQTGAIPESARGVANGVAELDANGHVKDTQLPPFVNNVLNFDTRASFPQEGSEGIIYIAEDTNLIYRWDEIGLGYRYIGYVLGETENTAYRGDRGKIAYDHSQLTSGNPHQVTKTDVGLSNVANERQYSAENKPTPAELGAATAADLAAHVGDTENPHQVTKSQVGLGNVANERQYSAENKPTPAEIGAAAATDLSAHISDKANPHEVTKAQVGLGNVANVLQYSAENKPSPSDIGAASASDLTAHESDKNNPHEVTKAQVGLENVANERQYSAQNKPSPSDIGAASQSDFTAHTSDQNNPHAVTKAQVGLSNVANERQYSAENKPTPAEIGAASQADLTSHVQNTSNPHSVTAAQAGALGNSSVATVETGTASKNYAIGGLMLIGSTLYKATAPIAQGDTLTVGTNIAAATVEELLAAKQDTLTFDLAPAENSLNPVTSGGVYTALSGKADNSIIATVETSTASKDYAGGDYLILGGTLYQATDAITEGSTITAGVNVQAAVLSDEFSPVEKTASGAIASFAGMNTQPLRSLNVNIDPVQAGSGDPSPDNVRPISGWSAVNVWRTGKNVWDEEWENGSINTSTGEILPAVSAIISKNRIPVVPGERYCFVKPSGVQGFGVFYDSNNNPVQYIAQTGDAIAYNLAVTFGTSTDYKFTVPAGATNMLFRIDNITVYSNNVSVNYPSTDNDYHPYSGTQYTIQLGQTIYGATLDVTNGVLTVDRAMVDLGTLTWSYYTGETYPVFNASVTGVKYPITAGSDNYLCSIYKSVPAKSLYQYASQNNDKTICKRTDNDKFLVQDSTYSDAATFKTAMSGVQLVYELATPITIQLTPTQISTLQGQNNVWADSGDVAVTYRAGTNALLSDIPAIDAVPTEGSSNTVSSGGVYDALAEKVNNASIAQVEASATATRNYAVNSLLILDGILYEAISAIAIGDTITPGTNVTAKTVAELMDGQSVKKGTVSISATWSGTGPYTQTVTVTGASITANSMVDLQPTAAQLNQLVEDGVTAMTVENSNGTLTLTALGEMPSTAMVMQATVTEVE